MIQGLGALTKPSFRKKEPLGGTISIDSPAALGMTVLVLLECLNMG